MDLELSVQQAEEQLELRHVFEYVNALKQKYVKRDTRARDVHLVRSGDYSALAPDSFNDAWPAPIVANLIDTYCRDFAATTAPLPAFNCASGSMSTETAKRFAQKRTRIANYYVETSRLAAQMHEGGDSYAAFGLLAGSVEPDFVGRRPRIRILDGSTVYPVWDRNMNTVKVAQAMWVDRVTLEAQYGNCRDALKKAESSAIFNGRVEVIKYEDKDICVTYLPGCGNHVLEAYKNPMGRCTIVAVPRPTSGNAWNGDIRGAYDDLIWPQIARHQFQLLAMEAAEKQVRSPLVVPTDVGDVPMGDDAVLRTAQGASSVAKVQFPFPQGAIAAMEQLSAEMRQGAMSPEARSGNIDASVITGRGVQQLMEGYSTQIAAAQEMFKLFFQQAIGLCFELDEKLWPDLEKTIRGTEQGAPFEVNYKPGKDIAGDYTVDVTYGFLAGPDANRALVYVLQARGDGLVSREFARRQLPANINVVEEEKRVQGEQLDDSLLMALSGVAQSIPQLVALGQDPAAIVLKVAEARKRLRKGEPIDEVISEIFAPPPPAPAPGSEPGAPATGAEAPGGAEGAAGFGPEGLPSQLNQNQALQGPGGKPSLQQLFAGLTSAGNPNLAAGVSRMRPAFGG
jgi:hypothetical protein